MTQISKDEANANVLGVKSSGVGPCFRAVLGHLGWTIAIDPRGFWLEMHAPPGHARLCFRQTKRPLCCFETRRCHNTPP